MSLLPPNDWARFNGLPLSALILNTIGNKSVREVTLCELRRAGQLDSGAWMAVKWATKREREREREKWILSVE